MVQGAIEKMGKVDIVVNNAGAPAGQDRVFVVDLKEDDFDLVQRVNVKGTFSVSRAIARYLTKRNDGGKMMNISSVSGLRGNALCCLLFFEICGGWVYAKYGARNGALWYYCECNLYWFGGYRTGIGHCQRVKTRRHFDRRNSRSDVGTLRAKLSAGSCWSAIGCGQCGCVFGLTRWRFYDWSSDQYFWWFGDAPLT